MKISSRYFHHNHLISGKKVKVTYRVYIQHMLIPDTCVTRALCRSLWCDRAICSEFVMRINDWYFNEFQQNCKRIYSVQRMCATSTLTSWNCIIYSLATTRKTVFDQIVCIEWKYAIRCRRPYFHSRKSPPAILIHNVLYSFAVYICGTRKCWLTDDSTKKWKSSHINADEQHKANSQCGVCS